MSPVIRIRLICLEGAAPQSIAGGNVDGMLTMLRSDGSLALRSPLGGAGFDWFMGAAATADGKLVLAGSSYSDDSESVGANSGSGEAYIVAFDATLAESASLERCRRFDGTAAMWESRSSLEQQWRQAGSRKAPR